MKDLLFLVLVIGFLILLNLFGGNPIIRIIINVSGLGFIIYLTIKLTKDLKQEGTGSALGKIWKWIKEVIDILFGLG